MRTVILTLASLFLTTSLFAATAVVTGTGSNRDAAKASAMQSASAMVPPGVRFYVVAERYRGSDGGYTGNWLYTGQIVYSSVFDGWFNHVASLNPWYHHNHHHAKAAVKPTNVHHHAASAGNHAKTTPHPSVHPAQFHAGKKR